MEIPGFTGDIATEPAVLAEHAKDASVFAVMPRAVLYPRDVAGIQAALAFVRERQKADPSAALSVRAGGTCMSGGSLSPGYILNLTRYMNAVTVDPASSTAQVEMGAPFSAIERMAGEHGLMFGAYTSSKDTCGIGGMIGNNASGEKSIRHGATIDNVLSLEVVLPDGEVITTGPRAIAELSVKEQQLWELAKTHQDALRAAMGRVRKVASGYRLERVITPEGMVDLTPLFVGSQATLGIITKATLRLVPIPTFTRLLIISIDDMQALPQALQIVASNNPEGVETFDINTYSKARKYLPKDATQLAPFFHDSTSLLLLAQFSEATQAMTDERAHAVAAEIMQTVPGSAVSYVENQGVADAAWHVRRASYAVLKDHTEGSFKAVPCIEDVVVPVDQFPAFIPELMAILKRHKVEYGFHGHIGEGALRIIPLFNFADPEVASQIIALTREVFALVKKCEGNMSADHNDGIIRTPFVREFYGEELYGAFMHVKDLFDPDGVLNPRKKTGGTEADIAQRIAR